MGLAEGVVWGAGGPQSAQGVRDGLCLSPSSAPHPTMSMGVPRPSPSLVGRQFPPVADGEPSPVPSPGVLSHETLF